MAFFKKVVTSIKDFEKYPELANQPVISTFKYFLLLMVILTIIISSIFIYQIYNFMQYVKNNIPDFEFVNNTLQIELDEPINTKDNNLFFKTFIIDTNDIENSQFKLYRNEIANSMTGIAFLKDRVLISVGKGIQPIEYSYDKLFESMGEDNLSKEEVVSVFDSDEIFYAMTIMLTTLFIYGFMYYFVDTLMLAILVTFLGYITSMIVRMRIKFYAIFNMAIYSFIHMFTGFEIIYFDIMYFGIACIYMITAILMIKLDLIKRGEELTKIIEEQARIAEWQKKDKENEEKNKKQDEEKKKEENKENDDVENKENKKEKQKDNNGRKEENTDKQENKEKEKDSVAEGSNNKEKEEKNGNDEEQKKKGKSKGSSGQSKNGTEKQKEDNGKTSSKKKTGKQRNNNEDSNRGLEPQGNMFENEKGIQE